MLVRTIAAVLILVAVAGCATVQPWEKGNIAKPQMALETDPLDAKFTQHTYFSKEASSGGYGAGGGGCGCN